MPPPRVNEQGYTAATAHAKAPRSEYRSEAGQRVCFGSNCVAKFGEGPLPGNNRIVTTTLLNQHCAGRPDLESMLLARAAKIVLQYSRSRGDIRGAELEGGTGAWAPCVRRPTPWSFAGGGLDQSPSTASAQRSTKLSLRLFLRDRLIASDDDHIATVVEGERQHRFRRWRADRIAAAAAFHPVPEIKAADFFLAQRRAYIIIGARPRHPATGAARMIITGGVN